MNVSNPPSFVPNGSNTYELQQQEANIVEALQNRSVLAIHAAAHSQTPTMMRLMLLQHLAALPIDNNNSSNSSDTNSSALSG